MRASISRRRDWSCEVAAGPFGQDRPAASRPRGRPLADRLGVEEDLDGPGRGQHNLAERVVDQIGGGVSALPDGIDRRELGDDPGSDRVLRLIILAAVRVHHSRSPRVRPGLDHDRRPSPERFAKGAGALGKEIVRRGELRHLHRLLEAVDRQKWNVPACRGCRLCRRSDRSRAGRLPSAGRTDRRRGVRSRRGRTLNQAWGWLQGKGCPARLGFRHSLLIALENHLQHRRPGGFGCLAISSFEGSLALFAEHRQFPQRVGLPLCRVDAWAASLSPFSFHSACCQQRRNQPERNPPQGIGPLAGVGPSSRCQRLEGAVRQGLIQPVKGVLDAGGVSRGQGRQARGNLHGEIVAVAAAKRSSALSSSASRSGAFAQAVIDSSNRLRMVLLSSDRG